MNLNDLRLCLLTHAPALTFPEYLPFLLQVIEGGITSVQFRDKRASKTERYQFAIQLKDTLSAYRIPLIINDDIELAHHINADGVHLGQQDSAPIKARERLKKNTWIGLSIETMAELHQANTCDDIQYVAASAVFPSLTKLDCKTYWGLEGLHRFVQQSRHPVVAIGGITLDNTPAVMQQGAAGIALINALHAAHDPKRTAEQFKQRLGLS